MREKYNYTFIIRLTSGKLNASQNFLSKPPCPSFLACHLSGQYGHVSCFTSALLDGQLFMMYDLRSYSCMSFSIASQMSWIIMCAGMFVIVSVVLILCCMPPVSSPMFFVLIATLLCIGLVWVFILCIFYIHVFLAGCSATSVILWLCPNPFVTAINIYWTCTWYCKFFVQWMVLFFILHIAQALKLQEVPEVLILLFSEIMVFETSSFPINKCSIHRTKQLIMIGSLWAATVPLTPFCLHIKWSSSILRLHLWYTSQERDSCVESRKCNLAELFVWSVFVYTASVLQVHSCLRIMILRITIYWQLSLETSVAILPIGSNVNFPCDKDFLYRFFMAIMTWKWAIDWLFLNFFFALLSVLSRPPHPLKVQS